MIPEAVQILPSLSAPGSLVVSEILEVSTMLQLGRHVQSWKDGLAEYIKQVDILS